MLRLSFGAIPQLQFMHDYTPFMHIMQTFFHKKCIFTLINYIFMHKFTLAIHYKMMYIEMQREIHRKASYFYQQTMPFYYRRISCLYNTIGGFRYERKSYFSVFRRS